MRKPHFLPIVCLCSLLASCATTSETDASKLSTADLLFGKKRLSNHLVARKQNLDKLQFETSSLALRVNDQERKLLRLDASFKEQQNRLGVVDDRSRQLEREMRDKQIEHQALKKRLQNLDSELQELRTSFNDKTAQSDELQQKIVERENEVASLTEEVKVLERAIERIVTARARHALDAS